MHFLSIILAAIQVSQPLSSVRGDRFQIMAPQGWKVVREGLEVLLEHSTGASVAVRRPRDSRQPRNLDVFALDAVEQIMAPLGFAKFEAPRRFKEGNQESVQYEIRGNRLSAHRRILYRAVRRNAVVFEVVYESSEERFDVLLTEAQSIASSLEVIVEPPPPPRGSARGRGRD